MLGGSQLPYPLLGAGPIVLDIEYVILAFVFLAQRTTGMSKEVDVLPVKGSLRTMHEITSRFVAQSHGVFGCSSIVESST